MKKLTNEIFIQKSKETHCEKYDYSKVEYVDACTPVCIICPEHGEFWQKPAYHLGGSECPMCANKKRQEKNIRVNNIARENFVERANDTHSSKYDYSQFVYKNNRTPGAIICHEKDKYGNEHGMFHQSPYAHLSGQGCPKCKAENINKERNLIAKETFEEKARKIHGDKYTYHGDYVDSRTKIMITCPKHGDFYQTPNEHLLGCGCPKCGNVFSIAEDEIIELLKAVNPIQRDRTVLKGKEIDVYIPSLKLGIEYNGLIWHSEKFNKDRHYHLDKLNGCNKQRIRLVQIFEDEWIDHREICESKLKQICGLNTNPKIYARKCDIHEITNKEAREFLGNNHIQGFVGSTVYLGAFYDSKIVGIMTFKKEKKDYWDLNRFATDINYQCVGVGGKLFKHFIKNYDFTEIKSFADRRWTIDPYDNLYTKLGFKLAEFTRPDYKYHIEGIMQRFHKFGFRKQILHNKYGFPLTMTESEMAKELKCHKIWDCGLIKYIFKNIKN